MLVFAEGKGTNNFGFSKRFKIFFIAENTKKRSFMPECNI